MARHGTIAVNGEIVGMWSAQRVEPMPPPSGDTLCTYRCTVVEHGPQGVSVDFEVEHRWGAGAVALAALVLETSLAYTWHLDRHHGKPQ